MNTKPLERFAAQARRDLLAAVDAQATAVLASGSVARTERAGAVKKLEAEIAAHGRTHVIDKVAYTWFNRIIALRFMDARSYTEAGVVSPAQGQAHGQPEILADAKRGNLKSDVVTNKNTAEAIIGLLDGTRRSTDPEGEAYALLLTEYCRNWHKSMPYMFEREGDYTELLFPANLLADGSILTRAREVLTEEVCDDVEVIGWLYQFYISERKDEIFAGFKKNKKAGAEEIPAATQLFTPHWIVRYLVENSLGRMWMLNRPTSRLVDRMDYYIAPIDEETDFLRIAGPEELTVIDPACGSGHMLTYAFDLLYAIYEEEGYAPSEIASLILSNNLHGTEIDPRAGSLAAFALTMKARAKQRTFFNKQVEPKICVIEAISFGPEQLDFLVTRDGDRHAEEAFWNEFAEADTYGSLIQPDATLTTRLARHLESFDKDGDMLQADLLHWAGRVVVQAQYLAPKYSVVVMNPPYMGSGNMSGPVSSWIKESYPDEKQDLYACFVVRSDKLVVPHGYTAMVTGDTWMTIKSFGKLRRRLLGNHAFLSFVHMHDVSNHSDIFGANTAFVIAKNGRPDTDGTYIYLDASSSEVKAQHLREAAEGQAPERVFLAQSAHFDEVPGSPLVFRISSAMRKAFHAGRRLNEIAEPRQGMATADNGRFLRLWFEVSGDRLGRNLTRKEAANSPFKWFPYNKGGEYRKWYGNQDWVVNWEKDGSELLAERPKSVIRSPQMYFLPSVSWSKVGTGIPAFRFFPQGFLFDVAGTSIFADTDRLYQIAAVCNSNVVRKMLAAISPTLNVEVGTISQLPVVEVSDYAVSAARELIELHRADWNEQETSSDFSDLNIVNMGDPSVQGAVSSILQSGRSLAERVRGLESKMNAEIAQSYGLGSEIDPDVPLSQVTLNANPVFRFGAGLSQRDLEDRFATERVGVLISYAVGCMFGRYSLDEPGLILADQGATLQDYLAKVPVPTFRPDVDNVIPFVDDGWFADDIVERFRQFLRAAFGAEQFEENLRFVEESLGVKTLRDYFITNAGKSKFYDDHVQRYKKRPIYWMFSSPKGSFNALIYMHRYNPATVSTVLNEYLREYRAKLEVAQINAEQAAAAGSAKDQKEADRLRKVLSELRDYEHDVLYPLATQQLAIDLDDGVKANYPKFYPALKKISGLEAAE